MQVVEVNILAAVACAIAAMITGFLWYGPLFGKAWMKSINLDPAIMNDPVRLKEMQSQAGPGYVAMFVASFVMAYVFAHVLGFSESQNIGDALQGAGWMWLGFVAAPAIGVKMFEQKSWLYFWVNSGYYLLNLLVFAVILTYWK